MGPAWERPKKGETRFLPVMLNLREQSGDEHQVDGSLTEDLVGDVDAVACLRVTDVGNLHELIVSPGGPRRNRIAESRSRNS
jgi:hypothetical protein